MTRIEELQQIIADWFEIEEMFEENPLTFSFSEFRSYMNAYHDARRELTDLLDQEPIRNILDDFHSACDLDDLLYCSLEYLYELRDGLVSEFDMNAQDNWEIRLIDTRIAQHNEGVIEVLATDIEDGLLLEPATEVASDDWLLEEWDNICSDPAGTRFAQTNPAPYTPTFNTYFEYVLWVIGEVVRGITYLLGEVNELFVSSQTTQLAT